MKEKRKKCKAEYSHLQTETKPFKVKSGFCDFFHPDLYFILTFVASDYSSCTTLCVWTVLPQSAIHFVEEKSTKTLGGFRLTRPFFAIPQSVLGKKLLFSKIFK